MTRSPQPNSTANFARSGIVAVDLLSRPKLRLKVSAAFNSELRVQGQFQLLGSEFTPCPMEFPLARLSLAVLGNHGILDQPEIQLVFSSALTHKGCSGINVEIATDIGDRNPPLLGGEQPAPIVASER